MTQLYLKQAKFRTDLQHIEVLLYGICISISQLLIFDFESNLYPNFVQWSKELNISQLHSEPIRWHKIGFEQYERPNTTQTATCIYQLFKITGGSISENQVTEEERKS